MKKNKIEQDTVTTRVYKTDKMYLSEIAEKHRKPEKDCFAEIVEFYKARQGKAAETVQTVQTVIDGAVSKMIKAFNELSGEIIESIARFSSVNNSVIQNINVKSFDLPEKKAYYINRIREEMAKNLNLWDIPHSERLEKLWVSVWNETPITDVKDWGTWYAKIQQTVEAQTLLKHKIEIYGVGRYGEKLYNQYILEEGGEEKVTNRLLSASNMFTEATIITKAIDEWAAKEQQKIEARRRRHEDYLREIQDYAVKIGTKVIIEKIKNRLNSATTEKEETTVVVQIKEQISSERAKQSKDAEAKKTAAAEKAKKDAADKEDERKKTAIRDREAEEQKGVKMLNDVFAEFKLNCSKIFFKTKWFDYILNAEPKDDPTAPGKAAEKLCQIIKDIKSIDGEKYLYDNYTDYVSRKISL